MGTRQYAVYILTNAARTVLYTGVTNDLQRRITEHKSRKGSSFTSRYHVDQLVYFELGDDIRQAIVREKQIKGGSRQKKLDLINAFNPAWKDLYEELFQQEAQKYCHCEELSGAWRHGRRSNLSVPRLLIFDHADQERDCFARQRKARSQ